MGCRVTGRESRAPPAEDGKEEPSTKKKMGGKSRDHMWVAS